MIESPQLAEPINDKKGCVAVYAASVTESEPRLSLCREFIEL